MRRPTASVPWARRRWRRWLRRCARSSPATLLHRLRRQAAASADPYLAALHEELSGYPGGQAEDDDPAAAVALPLRLRHDGRELAFVTTVATFGAPLDVTVAELAIESFYPADAATAEVLRTSTG
jgi:hypothetical protein